MLLRKSTWPMMPRVVALMTVMVSWALLATKTRRPSGEVTTFHGSAPVVRVPMTEALNVPQAGSLIWMIVTVPAAALATYAYWLSGVRATLWGSSPTAILARRVFVSGRMTLTESSLGFTTQMRRSLIETAIGLE